MRPKQMISLVAIRRIEELMEKEARLSAEVARLEAENAKLRDEVDTLTLAVDLGSSAIEALAAEKSELFAAVLSVRQADDIGSMHEAFRLCRKLVEKQEGPA